MSRKIKIATVFSGIGSIEFALKRMNIPHDIVFACDTGEREIEYDKKKEFCKVRKIKTQEKKARYVDELYKSKTRKHNFVKDTYLANYGDKSLIWYEDICLLDGRSYKNKIDLLVGGSPCQSFSSVGFKKGLADVRGTLFYEYARLIDEIKPKIFIYENVRNIINHDNGNTWEIVQGVFSSLGYSIDYKVLNSKNFGIPQNRSRLFLVGYRKDLHKKPTIPDGKVTTKKYVMQDFLIDNCKFGNFLYDKRTGNIKIKKSKGQVENKYFLSKAVKNYVLKDGTKNWHQKVETDLPIARTLLKTMGNCHRAGVDNYITYGNSIRMLTEREALRLMGYTDDFVANVSSSQIYKQAGNSIVVDVMMEIIKSIEKDLNWRGR